ncbi:MAG TPA: c-type cytochrome, partial [Gammaproteobacteria bacterium]|nr:c-type cytochrome [Gammaproteobacteria bacterium]
MTGLKQLAAFAAVSATLLLALPLQAAERWYDQKQVARGADLFAQNCASCHGAKGEGTKNWKTPDANGVYPPPPINGTGHAWHHDLALL